MRGVVMRVHRFYRQLARLWLPFFLAAMPFPVGAQEIPLKHCDSLPVVEVTVGSQPMLFLVDTAATSLLNLSSFTTGKAQGTRVTSWTGTLATSGRQGLRAKDRRRPRDGPACEAGGDDRHEAPVDARGHGERGSQPCNGGGNDGGNAP